MRLARVRLCRKKTTNYTTDFFYSNGQKKHQKNDYKGMRSIIDDTTYAEIVKILATDPKVALFQKLLLSEKVDYKPEEKPTDKKNAEVK